MAKPIERVELVRKVVATGVSIENQDARVLVDALDSRDAELREQAGKIRELEASKMAYQNAVRVLGRKIEGARAIHKPVEEIVAENQPEPATPGEAGPK